LEEFVVRVIAATALGVLIIAGVAVFAEEQSDAESRAPARTDEGNWDGTWYYKSRVEKMAMWIRTDNGKPEIRVQYQSTIAPDTFETDWTGKADYFVAGRPASFALELAEWDENTLHGKWEWTVPIPGRGRSETATFKAYRSGDGRRLIMIFTEHLRVETRGGTENRRTSSFSWGFTKLSKRHVLWEELVPS
jgi:hypothetical protein